MKKKTIRTRFGFFAFMVSRLLEGTGLKMVNLSERLSFSACRMVERSSL